MAQTMIPSPHAQHLLYFVHEVLRRFRTSCATLEIAMCYVGAIRQYTRGTNTSHAFGSSVQLFTAATRPPGCICRSSLQSAKDLPHFQLQNFTKIMHLNKAWAKPSVLPSREVTRCEHALGKALKWRLWVGRMPPTTALLGMDENLFMPPPTSVNGAGDVADIASCGRV